jgi:hypothetical protein
MKNWIILTTLLLSAATQAATTSNAEKLIGTWEVRSLVITSNSGTTKDFCPSVEGYLNYNTEGEMDVDIQCTDDLQKSDPAYAYDGIIYYEGAFKVKGDSIYHQVNSSHHNRFDGKTLVRKIEKLTRRSLILTGSFGNRGQTLKIELTRASKESTSNVSYAGNNYDYGVNTSRANDNSQPRQINYGDSEDLRMPSIQYPASDY